jgi:type VI secretion system secreted protein Hcp
VAESWFLKIDGVEGESANAAHKGEIDVESWSWGVVQTTAGPPGSGGGAGRPTFQDFQFTARISKASPQIFLACAGGTHHKWATLSGARTAGKSKGADFLTYKLSDVQVTSVQHSDSEAGPPMEQFGLNYAKFQITYRPETAAGQLGPPVTAGFDLQHNKKI